MPKPTVASLARLKPFDRVEVVWLDHYALDGARTVSKLFSDDFIVCERRTVGYFIGKNDEWLAIANHDDRNNGKTTDGDVEDVTVILTCGIKSIKKLS